VPDLWLLGLDVLVVGVLVVAYLRMRQVLVEVSATTTVLDGDVWPTIDDDTSERFTGVAHRGRFLAVFVVVQVDRDVLAVRSRPGFLGLHLMVPRGDVASARLEPVRKGGAPVLVMEPVEGRAVGLERLHLQLRGDPGSTRSALTRLGWVERSAADRTTRRRSGRAGRGGGRVTPPSSRSGR
jgi:hypothetical protein